MPGILICNGVIKGNGIITSKPVVVSAAIANLTPTNVDITFDQAMDAASVPATTAFTLAGKTISNVAIVGAVVTLTVTVRYEEGDVVTVDYTKPVLNPLQSLAGAVEADSFAALAVTNNFLYDFATLTPRGAGTGINAIMVAVSSNTTLVMDGAARFYSDAAATLDESTTWTITSGGNQIRYIRCAVESKMKFPHPELFTKWGDVFVAAGWTSPVNASSISLDIGKLYNLTQIYVQSANTIYGQVGGLTGLTALRLTYTNTCSINFTPLTLLDYLTVTGSGIYTGTLDGLSLLGASIAINGTNLSSSVTGTWNSGFTYAGTDITFTYTGILYSTHVWPANMIRFHCIGTAAYYWSVAMTTQCIIDAAATTWTGIKVLTLGQSSMADTSQGGIWGDFSGVPAPSALAVAYKTIKITLALVTTINGIVSPGVTGDGTGFPAGFGDWYRS